MSTKQHHLVGRSERTFADTEWVLELIAVGRTYGEVARTLMISEKTVSTHVSHLVAKTGTSNRIELARLAHRLGAEG